MVRIKRGQLRNELQALGLVKISKKQKFVEISFEKMNVQNEVGPFFHHAVTRGLDLRVSKEKHFD